MKNHKIYLRYLGGVKFHNKFYFVNDGFNGVFSLDLNSFSLQYMREIPFLNMGVQQAFWGNIHCCYENKILFFPANCNQIMVYNPETNDIQGIPIIPMDNSKEYMTAAIIPWNEQAYILPAKIVQGIFVLDLKTLNIKRSHVLNNILEETEYSGNSDNIVRMNETEIAILSGKYTIIGIDIQENKRTFCKQFTEDFYIWRIRYDGNDFWILSFTSTDVYRWNPAEDKLIKYQLEEEEWINSKGVPYVNIIFLDNQVILLPSCLKYIMRIDKETNTIKKAVEYPKGFYFFNGLISMPAFASFDIIEQHKILIHPVRGNMLLIYDIEKNHIEGRELTVTAEEIPYLQEVVEQRFHQEAGIVQETDHFGLELLDLAIAQNKKNRNREKAEQAGKEIYDSLVKQG